ncbi:hypothetical protein MASR2M66_07720 [Chloroflexota bacterium]
MRGGSPLGKGAKCDEPSIDKKNKKTNMRKEKYSFYFFGVCETRISGKQKNGCATQRKTHKKKNKPHFPPIWIRV